MSRRVKSGTPRRRTWPSISSLLVLTALGACKDDGAKPMLANPGPQSVKVGETLNLDLFASDPDGDTLEYSFTAGVPNVDETAQVTVNEAGGALFSFTPSASQVGTHIFDFQVTDGDHNVSVATTIEVLSAAGSGNAPVFKRPFSQGTVLDLETAECTQFDIEVTDADSSSIDLTQAPPVIQGAVLDAASNGLTGSWQWCPTREQIETDDQWSLTLVADDGDNREVEKDFVVVLRKPAGDNCPGGFPVVDHSAGDVNSVLDVRLDAAITDDRGLADPPVVLYGFEDPGDPVQFDKLSNVATMQLQDGTDADGSWSASIPSPVAAEPEGTSVTLYYLIQATDNDDTDGDCDHRTDAPSEGVFSITVTNSGEAGGAGLCETCSADVQCGEGPDLCLTDGGGENTCGRKCPDSGCPDGYACATGVTSVDGTSGDQCVPESGVCGGGGGTCEDDAAEDDDNPTQAMDLPPVGDGEYLGVLCPQDEDWWFVELDAEAKINASLSGPASEDIDLALTDGMGGLIQQSIAPGSDESIASACQPAGAYMLRVHAGLPLSGGADYDVTLAFDEDGCANTGESCCDPHDAPGCNDTAIETCVCDEDPFCCGLDDEGEGTWDSTCVGQIAEFDCAAPCP